MLEIDNRKIVLTLDQMKGYLSRAYSSYIKNGIRFKNFPSVMLWGPPGVGKSQGIREVAKDIELVNIKTLLRRVKDAYRVLIGKSRAYHFYEDTK